MTVGSSYDRRIIMEGIERHLSYEPIRASRSRIKAMRQPFWSQFRLRLEEFRVYYDVDDDLHQVQILRVLAKSNETTPEESPSATETPSASPAESPEAGRGKKGWPNVSLSPDAMEDYEKDPPKVREILDAGLALTKQNLGYTYGSADPANGGMDCSGFIYYVLKQNGFPDVPRDSSQQYVWVRKAGNFDAVLSHKEDSFEFDDLKPGDLLFWSGTYNIDRDPPITHTMIYLGREKRTNKRVMIGSSDGRTYDGKQRWGVSVFDFKMPPPPKSGDAKISPVFVGYGRIPGLSED